MAKKRRSEKKKKRKKGISGMSRGGEVFRLEVTLCETEPPVWRRFEMPSYATLDDLHRVLQIAMGWEDMHLHSFETRDGRRFAGPIPFSNQLPGIDAEDSRRVKLAELKEELRDGIIYVYDFGDNWEHEIKLVSARPAGPQDRTPKVLEGKRAAPPEDCGGVYGYDHLLHVLESGDEDEREEAIEGLGEFDPERFDREAVNRQLKRIKII